MDFSKMCQKFGQFSKETFFFLQETFKLRDFLQNFEQPIVDEIFSENWTRTSTIWQLDCKRTSADQRAAWSPAFTRSTVFEDINSWPLSSNILTWFLNWPLWKLLSNSRPPTLEQILYPRGLLFRPNSLTIGFQASSDETWVEKEKLIYPLSSLVAEFGGTLGLFLGFSFIGVWDQLGLVGMVLGRKIGGSWINIAKW